MIRTTNIRNGQVNLESVRYATGETYHQWTRRQIPTRGDILLTREAPMGEVGMLLTEDHVFLGQRIVSYRTNPDQLNNKFLLYAFQSDDLQNQIKAFASGSTVQHMRVPDTKALQIPLPSLPEQKRIVAILDDAFEGIDRTIANTKKNLANARELFKSYLNAIFTQNNDGWEAKRIEDVCEAIIDCINKTASTIDDPSPFKMIRTTNVRNGYVNLDSVKYVTEDTYRQWTRRQLPKKGDVLLTREAPMGEVGMLLTDDQVFLGQRIVSYRTDSNKLNNKFLLYALQSNDLQRQIKAFASGSTVQHMRVPDTKNLRIAIPSLSVQKQVVQNLDVLLFQAQRLEAIYQQKLAALNELKQSILQKAFTGELTADIANQATKTAEGAIAA